MKSTLITMCHKEFDSKLLNLLMSTIDSKISVESVMPEDISAAIKKAARSSKYVFISNDFLEFNDISYLPYLFKDSETLTDSQGRITAIFSLFGRTPIGVLPKDRETAQKFIYNYFYNNSNSKFNLSGSVFVSNNNVEFIEQTIKEFEKNKNIQIKIKNSSNFSEIFITASAENDEEANSLLIDTKQKIILLLGDDVFSLKNSRIEENVVNLLIEKNKKIATAESCTGGLMSQLITKVPNSSKVFEIGITSYSNRIKQYALSVNKDTIKNYGAVSHQTAAQMALGVKNLSGADIGVGITGVAGPSSSEGKPVGTVYVAITDGEHFWVRLLSLPPFTSRDEIRAPACFTAFDLVRRYIEASPSVLPNYSTDIDNITILNSQPHYKDSSLTFMRDSLDEFLKVQAAQQEKSDADEPLYPLNVNTIRANSPLYKLQKKVIKKHGVKFKFTIPKFSFKDYFDRLMNSNDMMKIISSSLIKITALILVSVIAMASVISVNYFYENRESIKVLNKIHELRPTSNEKNDQGMYTDFAPLKELNSDITAWLKIKGTRINYPVCSFTQNNYYKNRDYYKNRSNYGAIHFASDSALGFDVINTVIEGNNLENSKMFSSLTDYRNKDFANKAQLIELKTEKETLKYEVFAVAILTDNELHEMEGSFFDYTKTTFQSDFEFIFWLNEVKLRSLYHCNVPVSYQDKILTLVTDSNEFSSAKTAVFARLTNENTVIGTNPLTVNSSPKYPAIWYEINDIKNPYDYTPDYIVSTN